MIKSILGLVVLGLAALAVPSSANAQCGYVNGYSSNYYVPSYTYSSNYYTPTYSYNQSYYSTPSYGYNQSYYGGNSYYDVRRERVRRAVTLAVVVGAAIAISNNSNGRYRSNRNRNRRW